MQHTPGGEHGAIAFFQQKSGSVDYVARQRRCSSARATRKRLKTPSQTTIGMLLMRRIIRGSEGASVILVGFLFAGVSASGTGHRADADATHGWRSREVAKQ